MRDPFHIIMIMLGTLAMLVAFAALFALMGCAVPDSTFYVAEPVPETEFVYWGSVLTEEKR